MQSPEGLNPILAHLGPDWNAEYGLESPGSAGNRARLGFLFDSRKIAVEPVSSNMVLPTSYLRHTATGQPARPPFVAAFTLNGRSVLIANTQIVFGRPDARADRIAELNIIAENLSYHADKSFGGIPAVLAGQVNSEFVDGPVIAAIEKAGYHTDTELKAAPGSAFSGRIYDQIFVRNDPERRLVFGRSGSFNLFDYIMRDADLDLYRTELGREYALDGNKKLQRWRYRMWRSFQISDHRVKWAEFRMDW